MWIFLRKSVRAAKDNRTCTRSLALDIPLGEIISWTTRGNKKGQRARNRRIGGGGRDRDARKFLYGDYGGGALLHLLFPQVARAHYSWGGCLSLFFSLFFFFYFRLDVSAGAKAPGCVATNDEGFIDEDAQRTEGGHSGGGGGAWAAAGTVIEYPRI